MATKKDVEQVKPVEAEPVELSDGEAGGTPSTEPQPLQKPDEPETLIMPQGDKPPEEQPTLDEAPPDPEQIVLFRNDTNQPVIVGDFYLFPDNSMKAPRRLGAGKGLTEV